MGTIWFRMRSELKWREVEVTSTFITVGELRGLICDKLALDQRTDTVTVVSETDTDPFPDAKQLPRGSRVRVIRTTFEHLERLKTQLEEAEKKDTDTAAAAEDKGEAAPAPEPAKADESEDEFGPSVFDVDAQRRYEAKQAAAEAARLPAHPAGLPVSTVATDEPSDQPGPSAVAEPAKALVPVRAASPAESEDLVVTRDDSHAVPLEHLLGLSHRQASAAVKTEDEPSTALVPADGAAADAAGPSTKSLLEEHPEMFYKCKRFLPQATAELLYQAIGLPRALRRFEWRQFVLSNGGDDPDAAAQSDASTSDDAGGAARERRPRTASAQRSPSPPRRRRRRSRSASPRRRHRSRERSSERVRHGSDAPRSSARRRRRHDSRSLTPESDGDRRDARRRRRAHTSRSRSRDLHSSRGRVRSRDGSARRGTSRRASERRSRSRERGRASDRWYDKDDAMQETPEATPDSTLPEPIKQRLAGNVPRRSRSADSGHRSDSSHDRSVERGHGRSVRQRLRRRSDSSEEPARVVREVRGRGRDLRRQGVGGAAVDSSPVPRRERPRGLFAQALSTVARPQ